MTTVACYFAPEVAGFDEVLDEDVRSDRRLQRLGPRTFGDCEATLFFLRPIARTPPWVPVLQAGFEALPDPRAGSAGALLVLRVPEDPRNAFLAFAFGTGRFLLSQDACARGFGAKAALNVIFEGDDGSLPASRLQSVNATRHDVTLLQISHQTNRSSPFEVFGIDIIRDILREVVGTPVDEATWGSRVGGSDPLKLSFFPRFEALPSLSRRILDMGRRRDYSRRFDWIDHVREVREPTLRSRLTELVLGELARGATDEYGLVVPTVVEWDRIDRFQFDSDRAIRNQEPQRRVDPSVRSFLATLRAGTEISRSLLGRKHLYAIDGNGEPQYRWSIWSSLSRELEVDGRSYVLDNGAFFELDPDYDQLVRDFTDGIDISPFPLPNAVGTLGEEDYNKGAAAGSDGLLLMDRRLVAIQSRTSPVEICDLYSINGEFIHVKKHRGASSMSHLFSQGFVAADLLVTSREFRGAALDRLAEAAKIKARRGKPASRILEAFRTFDVTRPDPTDHRVVFAILDKRWHGRPTSRVLSFFSRVNLRRTVYDIQRLGFDVSLCKVPITPT